MKKISLFMWGMAMMAALTFTACSSSSDDDNGGEGGISGGNDGPAPTEFTYAPLTGIVENYGMPIKGVSVLSGDQVLATTDANGVFTLNQVPNKDGRTVLKFKKAGYTDIVRAMPKVDNDVWHVQMIADGNTRSASFNASEGGEVKVTRTVYNNGQAKEIEMKVELPNGYKDSKGNPYTGEVNAKMAYISPDDNNFSEAMPGGDLAAVRTNGSDAQLISYGMTGVELTDANGNALNLADGQEATVSFPIPASMEASAATLDEIPLWSFDEEKGIWVEEGVAKKEGNAYVGKVKHFSWWNLDYPESRATLKIKAVDSKGRKLQNVELNVDGQRTWYTNLEGYAEGFVPSDTKMFVEAVTAYETHRDDNVGPLTAGTTKELSFTFNAITTISGTVQTTGADSKVCVVELSCMTGTVKTVSDMLGRYKLYVPDTFKGLASLSATSSSGKTAFKDLMLDQTDKVVNLTFASEASANVKGQLMFKPTEGGEVKYELSDPDNKANYGVSVLDSTVEVSFYYYGENVERSFNIYIRNYEEGKTEFDVSSLYFRERINIPETNRYSNAQINLLGRGEAVKVTVTKSGDNMTFKIKDANVYNYLTEGSNTSYYTDKSENVYGTIDAEITVPVTFMAKSYLDTNASTIGGQLPSFMPLISGKSFHAMIVSKSDAMGKGAVVYYADASVTEADYKALCATLEQNFGAPIVPAGLSEEMLEEMQHHHHGFGNTYYKDGKYVNVSFNEYFEPNKDEGYKFQFDQSAIYGDNWSSKIGIVAFEGLNVPVSSLLRY